MVYGNRQIPRPRVYCILYIFSLHFSCLRVIFGLPSRLIVYIYIADLIDKEGLLVYCYQAAIFLQRSIVMKLFRDDKILPISIHTLKNSLINYSRHFCPNAASIATSSSLVGFCFYHNKLMIFYTVISGISSGPCFFFCIDSKHHILCILGQLLVLFVMCCFSAYLITLTMLLLMKLLM